MNLEELRKVCRSLLDDEVKPYLWSDEELDRYLNNAVREVCIRARLLKDDAVSLPELCEVPYSAGQLLVKHAKEILVVRSGMVPGWCHKLWCLTAESMDRHWPNWQSDTQQPCEPRYLIMDIAQKTVRLFPAPEADGVLQLRVWRMPLKKEQMCKRDDEPVVSLPDPEELKHWVAHEAYQKKDAETVDDGRSATHLQIFEQRFGSRPSLHEMARWADSPPRVRHAVMF
jgi:hypothetical protein